MKGKIQIILYLILCGFQSNLIMAQNSPSDDNSFPEENIDSLVNEAENAFIMWEKEHTLHKDNKDSAWISDFEGHNTYDSRTKSKEGKSITAIDSITNNYFVLDSTHTIIKAFNKSSQIIWQTNPRKDNSLQEYRHKNPVITYFKLGLIGRQESEFYKKGDKVLFIGYSNSQFGFLDLKTGKFTFEGQD
jgi:hypothetical protein